MVSLNNSVWFVRFKQRTTVVNALVRGVPAVGRPVTQLLVVHTLVATEARHLAWSTAGGTLLLIAAVQTVGFPVATPGLRHTLPPSGTAELVGPTS